MPFTEGVPSLISFLQELGTAILLVIATLGLQCAGIAALILWVRKALAGDIHRLGPFRSARLVARITTSVLALHGLLILLWAACYRWLCFRSWESAIYFSASSYATVGYGDLVLPARWRMLGPVESVIGVLMCGISASLLFATVTRLVSRDARSSR